MSQVEVVEKIESSTKVKQPSMYKVILHNDDKTTFDFVILILTRIFHRTVEDAVEITLAIHHQGQGLAGAPYTREIAEEKTLETMSYARANGFPLTATFEEI